MADWSDLRLHAWVSTLALFGCARPTIPNDRTPDFIDDERRKFIHQSLGFAPDDNLKITDPRKVEIIIDRRFVEKMLTQPPRTPYVPWAPYGITNPVEIWQKSEVSKTTGIAELRNYYLVPINDSKQHDGFVVIVGDRDNVAFNVFPFVASYADGNLRRNGNVIYRSYPPERQCSTECCARFVADRKMHAELKEQYRQMQKALKDERLRIKSLEAEIRSLNEALQNETPRAERGEHEA